MKKSWKKTPALIDERHSAGELSEGKYKEIREIIEKARAKDWDGAEKRATSSGRSSAIAVRTSTDLPPIVMKSRSCRRTFGGRTLREAAEDLGIAPRTADAWWAYARAWLAADLSRG